MSNAPAPAPDKKDGAPLSPAAMTERLIQAAVDYETAKGAYVAGARRELNEARAAIEARLAQREGLLANLTPIVDEFGGTIAQYHKIGPDYTFKDGTEVFEVSVVIDRQELIDDARAAIARATEA